MRFNRNCIILSAIILIITICLGAASAAAQEERKWIPIRGADEGTPAEVMLSEKSSPLVTIMDVVVHGFWIEDVKGPDGNLYQRIQIPGLTSVTQVGAPDLPVVRLDLAVVTSAKEVVLADGGGDQGVYLEGIRLYPQPQLGVEGREDVFTLDKEIYSSSKLWPEADGKALHAVRSKLGAIPGATVECYPVKWHPAKEVLVVSEYSQYIFSHAGEVVFETSVTPERDRGAEVAFFNWESIGDIIHVNWKQFASHFLFVYPSKYAEEIQPLVMQKKARGFVTTELTTEKTGSTCAAVRKAIKAWYAGHPTFPWVYDHYALLVGDVADIPMCTSPTGVPTDDLYASIDGDDLDEEVYLGRLSVDDEGDLMDQVDKILDYEDNPGFYPYHRALLVAHKENAPAKYVGAHEAVRTATYTNPPSFTTQYGHISGVTDATVSNYINKGFGLIAYRGHGSSTAWTNWNLIGDYFNTTDVAALTNPLNPVVWSFACTNSNLNYNDAIAEVWMEDVHYGAVSHYGATVPSGTIQNHALDKRMFEAVYDKDLTVQAQAIEFGEHWMGVDEGDANAWMYLLLGDPQMEIRRDDRRLRIKIVEPIACRVPNCILKLSILDEISNPVPYTLVAIYAQGLGGEEMQLNGYTDAKGMITLAFENPDAEILQVTARDLYGHSAVSEIALP